MEDKVSIWCRAHKNGLYLNEGDCFEDALLKNLKKAAILCSESRQVQTLASEIGELQETENKQAQDVLLSLHHEYVTLNMGFAKTLQLYDVVCPGCFISFADTDIGKAIVWLLEYAEMEFILYNREWLYPNHLILEFETSHPDFTSEVRAILCNGGFDGKYLNDPSLTNL